MHGFLTRLRKRLTFANLTSITALFIALGGTSYAAISVGSAEIRTGAVGASEIRTNAVGKPEIRTGGVGKSEVRTSAVGKSEIATNAVGKSEIAKDAVDTIELKDGGIEVADLSAAAKSTLTVGRANVTKEGTAAGGNAKSVAHAAATPGVYTVEFDHDVSACTYGATAAAVKNGTTVEPAQNGRITVAPGTANTQVVVNTFAADGTTPADAPFHLLVAC
jgi:hypothetical protein